MLDRLLVGRQLAPLQAHSGQPARRHGLRDPADQLAFPSTHAHPTNADLVSEWVEAWRPLVVDAVEILAGAAVLAPVPMAPSTVSRGVIARVPL